MSVFFHTNCIEKTVYLAECDFTSSSCGGKCILGYPGAASRDCDIFAGERFFRTRGRAPRNLLLPKQFQKLVPLIARKIFVWSVSEDVHSGESDAFLGPIYMVSCTRDNPLLELPWASCQERPASLIFTVTSGLRFTRARNLNKERTESGS